MKAEPITSPQPKGIKRYNTVPLWMAGAGIFVLLVWVVLSTDNPQDDMQQSKEQLNASEMAKLKQKQQYQSSSWYSNEMVAEKAPDSPKSTGRSLPSQLEPADDSTADAPAEEYQSEYDIKVQEIYEKAALEKEQYIARLPQKRLEQRNDGIRSPLKVFSVNNEEGAANTPRIQRLSNNGTYNNLSRDSLIPQLAGRAALHADDADTYAGQNMQQQKSDFLNVMDVSENYLTRKKQAPLSPYEIKAGTVLPAALITGINSDLPGTITAQIREHVYDTVTGNHLLVPQGSKLVGSYDSNVSFGQDRALVVWNRLIMPDGSSINLEKMQGVDISGYAGFSDQVDHHYSRIYGNALLLSLVGSGYELLVNNNDNNDDNDPQDTVAAQVGLQLAQVTNQISRRNINIQPTIKIRPGYRFNVMVVKDMILEP